MYIVRNANFRPMTTHPYFSSRIDHLFRPQHFDFFLGTRPSLTSKAYINTKNAMNYVFIIETDGGYFTKSSYFLKCWGG